MREDLLDKGHISGVENLKIEIKEKIIEQRREQKGNGQHQNECFSNGPLAEKDLAKVLHMPK